MQTRVIGIDASERKYLDAFYGLRGAKTDEQKILALQRQTGYTHTDAKTTSEQLRALELAMIADELM